MFFIKRIKRFFQDIFSSDKKDTPYHSKRRVRSFKIYSVIILAILDVLLLLYMFNKPVSFVYIPDNVYISNITDSKATISWVTKKPIKTSVLVSNNESFPLLPFFSRVHVDDKDIILNKVNSDQKIVERQLPYTVHHVTVDNLVPNRTYRFGIYIGLKKIRQVRFTTAKAFNNSKVASVGKEIIQGQIVASDKKTQVPGANVYFRVNTATQSSALLSTISNQDGVWSFNLSDLKSRDLIDPFEIKDGSRQEITIETGHLGRYEISNKSALQKDWATIYLRKN